MTTLANPRAADPRGRPTDVQRLASLRSELDAINLQLLATLEARGRLVREVMATKRRLGRPAHDPQRERMMMEALLRQTADVYPQAALEGVFRAIFAASRALGAELADAELRRSSSRQDRALR